MNKLAFRALTLSTALAVAPAAFAIQVEPDHPDLQRPQARLVEDGRAMEASINGGATSMSASGFTGLSDQRVKRKPFPPGYGLSGYEFEDEILRTPSADASATTEQTLEGAQAPASAPKR